MKFDSHLHTYPFSQDSRQSIEELVHALGQQSLGGILTEHLDFDYPLDANIVLFNPEEYFEKYLPLRSDHLLLGVEIGLQESCRSQNTEVAKDHPWDFVLGSVHLLHGQDLYGPTYYKDRSKNEVYQDYLHALITETSELDDFDSLGHIDYICRYNSYADPNLHYADFPDLWDQLFKVLIYKEKALELNTRRLTQDGATDSLFVLLKRYRELGGNYLTIGSDAHMPHSVGNQLDLAYHMAEKNNLTPVYFKDRKIHFVK